MSMQNGPVWWHGIFPFLFYCLPPSLPILWIYWIQNELLWYPLTPLSAAVPVLMIHLEVSTFPKAAFPPAHLSCKCSACGFGVKLHADTNSMATETVGADTEAVPADRWNTFVDSLFEERWMEVEEKLMKKGGQKQSLAERMEGVRVCFCGMYQLINFLLWLLQVTVSLWGEFEGPLDRHCQSQ